jgi:hypothetical protein
MTLPAWPGTLPAFALSDNFQSQQRENRIFFGTEVGPGKTRTAHDRADERLQLVIHRERH